MVLSTVSLIYLQTENPEDLYSRPFKQPTVESCNGNSYMISNGSSGFYHTGSRSRLYGTDLEDTIYSTPPKLPPKIDLYCEIPTPKLQVKSDNSTLTRREHNSTLTRRESTSRTIASSVYSKCLGYSNSYIRRIVSKSQLVTIYIFVLLLIRQIGFPFEISLNITHSRITKSENLGN